MFNFKIEIIDTFVLNYIHKFPTTIYFFRYSVPDCPVEIPDTSNSRDLNKIVGCMLSQGILLAILYTCVLELNFKV